MRTYTFTSSKYSRFEVTAMFFFLGWPSQGKQQPVDVLCGLVYAAARFGVESFIRMVFGTSAGRIIFSRYCNKSPLPEELADRNGQNEMAAYLRSVKERY